MVLRAVELAGFIGPGLLQQRAGEDGQMGDVVAPPQIIRRKIRLKMVAAQLFQVGGEHDLVTIDKIRPGTLDSLHTFKEGVGVEQIVVVQQGQIRPLRQRKARRGVGGDAPVFDLLVGDARILRRRSRGPRVGCVGGVHQHQLPAGVGLLFDAAQHLAEEFFRRVVHRHHNAHRGAVQRGGALRSQFPAQRQVGPVPPGIVVQRQPHPEGHIPPKLLGPLLPQSSGAAGGQVLQVGGVQQPPGHAAHTVLHRQVGGAVLIAPVRGRLLCHGEHRLCNRVRSREARRAARLPRFPSLFFRLHRVLLLEFAVFGGDSGGGAVAAQMAVVQPSHLVAHPLDLFDGVAD